MASTSAPTVEEESESLSLNEASSPLLERPTVAECRICQEEDTADKMESPCACAGSLKFAHRKCIQRWCNEKGNSTCEICHQSYSGGYTAVPRRQLLSQEQIPMELRQEISLPFGPRPVLPPDARVYAVRDGDQVYLEVEYDDYEANNTTAASWCRSLALMLLAMLLLRHALGPMGGDSDEGEVDLFTLFIFKAIGVLIPCFIMARAWSLLQTSRQMAMLQAPGAISFREVDRPDAITAAISSQQQQTADAAIVEQAAPNAPLVQNQA